MDINKCKYCFGNGIILTYNDLTVPCICTSKIKQQLKEKHLREIKTLESEYSLNIHHIENLHERQKDVTSRIQILLNKIK